MERGTSPSEIGISVTKTGTMEFDATKFGDALAKDPAGTMAAGPAIAGRVADAAKQASDSTTALLSTKITGQQSEAAKDLPTRSQTGTTAARNPAGPRCSAPTRRWKWPSAA